MSIIKITLCKEQDAQQLATLGRVTFYDTFATQNTADDMEQYLNATFTSEQIRSELNDPNVSYYLATAEQEPIGYLKLNFSGAQTEFQDKQALEIERIYVAKAYLGAGIGQLLMDKAIAVAKEAGLEYVWLGVWEHNPRAIRFYEKQGFEKFGSHAFMLGQDEQIDILLKLPLK